jgi:HK97 family phage major capsid protein
VKDETIYRDARGRPYRLHRGRVIPVIVGGDDDLQAVLGRLNDAATALATRETRGEDVKAEKAEVEAKIAETKSAIATAERDELMALRAEKRERNEREIAEAAVKTVMTGVLNDQKESEERIARYAAEAVRNALGGQVDVETAVKNALTGHPGISRYVGQGATEEAAKHVADGGGYHLQKPAYGGEVARVGEHRGVKALNDTKSIVQVMASLKNVRSGVASEAERFWIQELGQKALAEGTASAGGVLVPQEWMPDVLGLLRAMAVVRRANPRVVPFDKLMNQTSLSTGATAYYTAENAAIPTSEPTFAEAPLLTPKNLTGLVPVSNYLLNDAPRAEEIVRADLAEVLALREDLAFLRGTGGSGEPRGFKNIVGITLNPFPLSGGDANGFAMSLGRLIELRAIFRSQNAGAVRPAWFFHPDFLTGLEGLTDTTGRLLLETAQLNENEDGVTGTLMGIPFFASTQIPNNLTVGTSTDTSEVYLVNMAETIIGENQDLVIDVSDQATYTTDGGTTWVSAFQNNQSLFRAVLRHDIAHRRPAQIILQAGVRV